MLNAIFLRRLTKFDCFKKIKRGHKGENKIIDIGGKL